jgi:hypothetical protein
MQIVILKFCRKQWCFAMDVSGENDVNSICRKHFQSMKLNIWLAMWQTMPYIPIHGNTSNYTIITNTQVDGTRRLEQPFSDRNDAP